MARYTCSGCGEESNTLSPPHLCKRLKKRYERQAKAVESVSEILKKYQWGFADGEIEEVSLEIIRKLSGRDLGDN